MGAQVATAPHGLRREKGAQPEWQKSCLPLPAKKRSIQKNENLLHILKICNLCHWFGDIIPEVIVNTGVALGLSKSRVRFLIKCPLIFIYLIYGAQSLSAFYEASKALGDFHAIMAPPIKYSKENLSRIFLT